MFRKLNRGALAAAVIVLGLVVYYVIRHVTLMPLRDQSLDLIQKAVNLHRQTLEKVYDNPTVTETFFDDCQRELIDGLKPLFQNDEKALQNLEDSARQTIDFMRGQYQIVGTTYDRLPGCFSKITPIDGTLTKRNVELDYKSNFTYATTFDRNSGMPVSLFEFVYPDMQNSRTAGSLDAYVIRTSDGVSLFSFYLHLTYDTVGKEVIYR